MNSLTDAYLSLSLNANTVGLNYTQKKLRMHIGTANNSFCCGTCGLRTFFASLRDYIRPLISCPVSVSELVRLTAI